jgi:hypothetical protein
VRLRLGPPSGSSEAAGLRAGRPGVLARSSGSAGRDAGRFETEIGVESTVVKLLRL